ncbi:acyl-CoA synthetase (AMP-forming)/AMP-acid ligase II [Sphingomonas sp. SORGH_AS802]|uniref:AMP-binding protein n=1 Tax=unclassified Sphingomonas TaxID=196159 RepID=UPI00285B2848|nr:MULTISPECIES: AMP-binding protein [unclassified Sphingomonas]MDR6134628.1 acyl-CoA synthetase (AMP-forming)/AMP-acid ligase II [Sphingomonas sp. SORGH_AS_0802]
MTDLDPIARPLDHLPARGAPDAPALTDRAGTLSFRELDDAVGALAAWLAARAGPGDRVASWLPKTRIACILPLAAARAGLVHVPVNPALRRAQVAHILADSGATLLISQPARLATLAPEDLPPAMGTAVEADCPMDGSGLSASLADPAALAAILYTSGSTGRPKGVMLSHANLWLGAISVAHYLRLTPADRVLAVLPLSFDYGQNQLLSSWAAGASVVPLDYLAARDVVKAVARFDATTLAGVPPLWVQLLEADWPKETAASLRRLTNSGGALTPRMVRALRDRFPRADLYPMYGLTEAFRSTYLDPALVDAHPDSIGRAIPFAAVAPVRTDGRRAAPGEPGELVHAGPLVAQGYWQDAERTAHRFRPAPSWLGEGMAVWSGDTVVEDAEGLLRFVGRDDEMIKVAGNRVSPQEVEEAILSGGEALEAVAVGVRDDRLGQAIVAMVAGDAAREAGLRTRLRAELPSFLQPQYYRWFAELPRNANGKLDRAALRRLATE